MSSLREINQMEREMCYYLKWILNVKPEELSEFESEVERDCSVDETKAPAPLSTSPVPSSSATTALAPFIAPAPVARIVVHATTTTASAYSPDSTDSSPPSPSHSDGPSPTSSDPRTPPTSSRTAASVRKTSAVLMPKQPSVAPPMHIQVAKQRIQEQDGVKHCVCKSREVVEKTPFSHSRHPSVSQCIHPAFHPLGAIYVGSLPLSPWSLLSPTSSPLSPSSSYNPLNVVLG